MDLANKEEDFRVTCETGKLILGTIWEGNYLIDKENDKEYLLGELDGVTIIGLIDVNDEWALTGRELLLIWRRGTVIRIDKEELKCIEGIKLLSPNEVELVIDTLNLNNNRSIWKINMDSLELTRIS